MRFRWEITDTDVQRVKGAIAAKAESGLVKVRRARNLAAVKPPVTREQFWDVLVACLLTSVQRSGPDSFVSNFLKQTPLPLRLEVCQADCDVAAVAQAKLQRFGGIRFGKRIGEQLSANLVRVKGDAWTKYVDALDRLRTEQTVEAERRTARLLAGDFGGIGPKQSRNLLQILGLTRYEIPVDSRIVDWLKAFGFPVPLSAAALSDVEYYEFGEDAVQLLCREAGEYPCIFDAAIFASFDPRDWTEEEAVW